MLIILEYERKDHLIIHDVVEKKAMCMYMVEVLVCYFGFSYPMNGMVAFGKHSF